MNKAIDFDDVIAVAREFEIEPNDALESFLCELLNVSADKLYEILEVA